MSHTTRGKNVKKLTLFGSLPFNNVAMASFITDYKNSTMIKTKITEMGDFSHLKNVRSISYYHFKEC